MTRTPEEVFAHHGQELGAGNLEGIVEDYTEDAILIVNKKVYRGKDGARQVWIQDRMADKRWTLKEGETFQVGGHQGRVQSITAEEVIVELDGQRRRHRVGENLSSGVEVKP